jgi:nucleotidyltransferase substrate binding protein (TIGR01987 family)
MTSDRTRLQIDQFEKALGRLHEVLAMNETDVVRDALIQRFEFTFEMAWRSLWRWLNDRGERLPEKAYDVLVSALQGKLISDAALWDQIREYRNLTSHTYKEETAIQVAAFVRSDAVQAFDSVLAELSRRK